MCGAASDRISVAAAAIATSATNSSTSSKCASRAADHCRPDPELQISVFNSDPAPASTIRRRQYDLSPPTAYILIQAVAPSVSDPPSIATSRFQITVSILPIRRILLDPTPLSADLRFHIARIQGEEEIKKRGSQELLGLSIQADQIQSEGMMQNLLLQSGDTVHLKNGTLPKGTYVKLQPHTTDFLDISNPKAILETTLRSFSCLTTGDSIMVAYNNKQYYIDIVETKPARAISIIETDCEVDFAPPLDYKEPERVQQPLPSSKAQAQDEDIGRIPEEISIGVICMGEDARTAKWSQEA